MNPGVLLLPMPDEPERSKGDVPRRHHSDPETSREAAKGLSEFRDYLARVLCIEQNGWTNRVRKEHRIAAVA